MMTIQTKRVYDPVEQGDGTRVLVDRVWPRGISKERLKADLWLKDAAPSTPLRKWFNHDPDRWEAFKERYFAELDGNRQATDQRFALLEKGTVTLLFSARDTRQNQAVALKEYLISRHNHMKKRRKL
jgi:uncharacterized protein YeaO (DUF488 family)